MTIDLSSISDFELSPFAKNLFDNKYAQFSGETFEQACKRVSNHIASIEDPKRIEETRQEFYQILRKSVFIPGGRIWYGSGRPKGQLANCFHLAIRDSMDEKFGWSDTIKNCMDITSYGGGIGLSLSLCRPRGAPIKMKGGASSGAVSPARIANSVCNEIKTGGGRRSALLASLVMNHPDIEEFINSKFKTSDLNNTNISIEFTENFTFENFIKAVEKDDSIDLEWNNKKFAKIKAKKIWNMFLDYCLKTGEPGILNIDYMNKMNNVFYDKRITGCNPCFTKDTLILSGDCNEIGIVHKSYTVEEIKNKLQNKEDVYVASYNIKTNRIEPKKVTNFYENGKKKICEIYFEKHYKRVPYLKLTEEHDVYIETNEGNIEKRKVKDLKVGDEVVGFERGFSEYYEDSTGLFNKEIINEECESQCYNCCIEDIKMNVCEEEVYDITVEDNHNLFAQVLVNEKDKITGNWYLISNCSEISMTHGESCILGSLVLPRFFIKKDFQFDLFAEVIHSSVRFLDNVIDVNYYPVNFIEEETKKYRRIGLGTMGLHDLLIELGMKYNSKEALEFTEKLFKFKRDQEYEASTYLAAEKGSFPKFDVKKMFENDDLGFVKTLKIGTQSRIKRYGLRNVSVATNAPTGTTSQIAGVSSGIEPFFALAYQRNYKINDELKSDVVVQPIFERYIKENKKIDNFQNCYEISVEDHLKMQSIIQKYIDGSISKTINIVTEEYKDKGSNIKILKDFNCEIITKEELDKLLRKYFPSLKGVTLYPNESRNIGDQQIQPIVPLSREESLNIVKSGNYVIESDSKCKNGTCEL